MANLEDILSGRSGEYQLNNAEIIAGGNWSWDATLNTLSWSSGAYISVPGMILAANAITAGNVVMAAGAVAYVIANIRNNSPSSLTITVVANAGLLPQRNDLYILARRDGADVILDDEYRLMDGQSFTIGQTPYETPDPYWEQLQLLSDTTESIQIQNSDYVFEGGTLTFTLLGKVVEFAGASINFTTGVVTGANSTGMLPITTAITTDTHYAWYIFSLAADATQPNGSSEVKINVSIGSSNAVAANAVYPTMLPSVPIGAVRVQRQGSVALVDDVRKFGGQGSSTGSVILTGYNNTGSTIVAGTVVGAHPSTPGYLVVPQADSINNCKSVIGVVIADIPNASTGLVQVAGEATIAPGGLTLGARAYLSATTAGQLTSTAPTGTGTVVFVVGFATAADKIVVVPHLDTINTNVYEEPKLVVSGAPADTNEITGPVVNGTAITLPNDSRNGGASRSYTVGSGLLEVYLNGVKQSLGDDYNEVGAPLSSSTQIQILQDLLITDMLIFRINLSGEAYFSGGGGGGSDTLQSAYLNGNTINITTGVPVTITGASGKLLSVQGDMEVTGVIDPTGLELTPVASNPLAVDKPGIYADFATRDLIYSKGDGSNPVNIISSIQFSASSELVKSMFLNQSGSLIPAFCPVSIDALGGIKQTNPSIQNDAEKVIGVTMSAISNNSSGYIALAGRLIDVLGIISLGDKVWVAKDGTLTNITPEIGINGFIAGDYVVKIGAVASNNETPTDKDLVLTVQLIGQL